MSGDKPLTMVQRWVLAAVPLLPQMVTAADVAARLPTLSRSTVDRTLRILASSHVMRFDAPNESGVPRAYGRYPEGSLL